MNPTPPASGPVTTTGGPSNGKATIRKKPKDVDPLFRKKPQVRPLSKPLPNGRLAPPLKPLQAPSPHSHRSASPSKASPPPEERVSGFSDPKVAPGTFQDYKVVTTKRGLVEGLRFHLLQFAGDKQIDIRDESEFTRPVRLHRRDPKAAAPGQVKEEGDEPKDGLDKAEREELNARKEARQRERELNLAQIAPSANAGKKLAAFKKGTAQVWTANRTAEDRRRIQTNYEEKLPWHLEDFDNKHCFIGSHQAGSSNVHAAFVYEPSLDSATGKFRLLPVEKLYNFKPKRDKVIKEMTIEEVEAAMKKSGRAPEWLVRQQEARIKEQQRDLVSRQSRGLFSGAQRETIAGRQGEEADFDFEDDFADDEEGNLFEEKDEDTKVAEKRIKEDQLKANLFDLKEEKEYDREAEIERRNEEARKKIDKEMNRKLERREKNYNHGSDSDDMFDDSTSSEEERQKVEDEKKANREKAEAEKKSGLSSGANTPSGRREKHGGIDSDRDGGMKKSNSMKSLKRPGSPNLSEASGTDASVRKKKKHRHLSSTQPTPQPSRPISPANVPSSSAPDQRKDSLEPTGKPFIKKRRSMAPGVAGSDTETAAYSDGGAMSDGSKAGAKRLKISMGVKSPPTLTPQGGSRSASPKPPAATPAAAATAFPTAQEIYAAIPANGVSSSELLRLFKNRTAGRREEFFTIVKGVARLDKVSKLLMPKATAPAAP